MSPSAPNPPCQSGATAAEERSWWARTVNPERRETAALLSRASARQTKGLAALITAIALLLALVVPVSAASSPQTGRFSFTDDFLADCAGIPLRIVLQVQGEFVFFTDAQGNPASLIVHETWFGSDTDLDNGHVIPEQGDITDHYDFAAGTVAESGSIHLEVPYGNEFGHDRGLIVFSLVDGSILVQHGPHPGADGNGTACVAFL